MRMSAGMLRGLKSRRERRETERGCGMMRTLKREDCAVLTLVLKGRWYDMIASGEKKEEYRDATRYWETRLRNWTRRIYIECKLPVVEFRCGYASCAPRMAFLVEKRVFGYWTFLHAGTVRHSEWGEPDTQHYVISLGERVVLE